MRELILAYIKKIITHKSSCLYPEEKCSCGEIAEDTSLIKGGYLDSFSMVAVLVFIEKNFNIKIPEKNATPENFDSVNNILSLCQTFTS